jgi:hypothetical protein
VKSRYIKPAEPPPDPCRLEEYLRDAQPTVKDIEREGAEVIEERRVKAVKAIHAIYQRYKTDPAPLFEELLTRQWEEYIWSLPEKHREKAINDLHTAENIGAVPHEFCVELQDFVDQNMRIIFASPSPVTEMQKFFGQRPPKLGHPLVENEFRNNMISADVAERVEAGVKFAAAIAEVAEQTGLSKSSIEQIYIQHHDDLVVKAELDERRLKKSES